MKTVSLGHGNGGKLSHELINSVFVKSFDNAALTELGDGAKLRLPAMESSGQLAFTTDSFVVSPLFFPGGDIGKLAVTGTINDLAALGAIPLYLSCAMIIEEGFEIDKLRLIAGSMAETARQAGVKIVTGDTKVVPKGAADGLFINTSGIGVLRPEAPKGPQAIEPGDKLLITGSVGDHGISIYAGREGIRFETKLESDCAVLTDLADIAMRTCPEVRVMRDPTRGGLATTVNEFVNGTHYNIELDEKSIPIKCEVAGACELLGFDPLYVANEGKLLLVVPNHYAEKVLEALRSHPLARQSAIIGSVRPGNGKVTLRTVVGGERVLDMLVGEMLPRIC